MVAILVMLGCVAFSACGDKYKDLNMTFYSDEGIEITELGILLENETTSTNIGIKFSGIKNKDIGEIEVKSSLVTASNYSYENNMVYVDITPKMSGYGNLKVEHLSSGKTTSINLVIDKKSKTVTANDDRLIIVIPEETDSNIIDPYAINYRDIISLDAGSTDKVMYKVDSDASIPNGIEFYTLNDDGSWKSIVNPKSDKFSHIKANSSTINKSSIKIYPVLYMDNEYGYAYEDTPYINETIDVVFLKTLTKENVILHSNDKIQAQDSSFGAEYNGEEITIIVKDNGTYGDNKFSFNTAQFVIKYDDKSDAIEACDIKEFLEYYTVEWETSTSAIFVTPVEDMYIVQAGSYTGNLEEVSFKLVPKDAVGEISIVEKTVKIKPEVKPNAIQVQMQDSILSEGDSIDLFDYYASSGNALGARFEFSPMPEYAYEDMQSMRLVINPKLINAKLNDNTGLNPIYGATNLDGYRTNRYVLDFYIYNEPMEFNYNSVTGLLESELIDSSKSIYIKYTEILENDEDDELTIDIKSIYTGDVEYLKYVSNVSRTLIFNRQDGVSSVILNAGVLTEEENLSVRIYTDKDNQNYVVDSVYLNVNQTEILDNQSHILYISDTGVLGYQGKTVTSTEFTVSVTTIDGKVLDKGLKLRQGRQKKVDNKGNTILEDGVPVLQDPANTIEYTYSAGSASTANRSIELIYNQDTIVGKYLIIFTHKSGYTKSVNVEVYEELTSENLEYSLTTNDNAFKNKIDQADTTQYLYGDYTADYILSNKTKDGNSQKLDFGIELVNLYTDDYIIGYDYTASLIDGDGNILGENDNQYLTINKGANTASLTFNKGTYIEDKPCYINLKVTIYVRSYANIVEQKSTPDEVYLDLTFYVYDLITKDDFIIGQTNFTKYANELLGAYNKDESYLDLSVQLKEENLWNYTTTSIEHSVDNNVDETEKSVIWYTSTPSTLAQITTQDDKSLSLQFNSLANETYYTVDLFAEVWQFGVANTLKYTINVYNPVITERVVITSPTDEYNTDNYNPYINLKVGKSYTVIAENESNLGRVTHPGVVLQVVDAYGNADLNNVTIEGNKIIVNSEISPSNSKLKLIVFAEDALNTIIPVGASGLFDFDNLFITIDANGPYSSRYLKAYAIIDLILSDGSKANPYLIRDTEEFWEINNDKDAHYKVMTNIDISNRSLYATIDGFSGSIVTETDNKGVAYTYSVYGLTIDNNFNYLFNNFIGEINNINFIVNYNINDRLSTGITKNYGVFGVVDRSDDNIGTLNNVTVNISGRVSVYKNIDNTTNTLAYFGGLVAVNKGILKYTSRDLIGTNGNISIIGNIEMYAGGLIGVNYGSVYKNNGISINSTYSLTDSTNNNSINFTALIGNSGAIANVKIDASELNHTNSAVGGVVGLNTYNSTLTPTINDIYVTGEIKGVNNIGGVIGKNISRENLIQLVVDNQGLQDVKYLNNTSLSVENDYITMINVESTVKIKATGTNAGGLVGNDTNGVYYHTNYKILSNGDVSISGRTNVGGLIGNSISSIVVFSYVSSYRWDYSDINDTFDGKVADIIGVNNVGGLIGFTSGSSFNATIQGSISDGSTGRSTVVQYSSVNANIQANNSAGGIIGEVLETEVRYFIINAYFMGYLNVIELGDVILTNSNDAQAIVYNYVYTVNYDAIKDNLIDWNYMSKVDGFAIKENPNLSNWAYASDINGGYIYLTFNNKSLVDLAPTSLNTIVIDPYGNNSGRYYIVDTDNNEVIVSIDKIHFNYYAVDISIDDMNYDSMVQRMESKNTYKILDILEFFKTPESIDNLRLNVTSSDSSVIFISGDNLIVKREGEATLTFTSVLNNAIRTQVRVSVSKPLGEKLILSESADDETKDITKINGGVQNITKGKTKQYYLIQTGSEVTGLFNANGDPYRELTNDNIYYHVEVTAKDGVNISEYIGIGGKTAETVDNKMALTLDNKIPFSISVYKHIENVEFSILVTPFKLVKIDDKEIHINATPIEFIVATYSGPYDISLSHDSVILYPNDTTTITAYVSTDIPLTPQMISEFEIGVDINGVNVDDIDKYIEYKGKGTYDANAELQEVYFRIKFDESANIATKSIMRIYVEIMGVGENASVEFTLLPQRIDSIDIKNYNYTNDNKNDLESSTILRPNSEGMVIINIAPVNAYYDYVEISDITGKEEIIFAQLDSVGGSRLSYMDEVSSDSLGIKLAVGENADSLDKSLYVETMISNLYSNIIHRLKVVAYLEDGNSVSEPYYIDIDVRMLPSISATYVEPNGNTPKSYTSENGNIETLYLANGVEAEIKVETRNSSGTFNHIVSIEGVDASDYIISEAKDDSVIVRFTKVDDTLLGRELNVKLTTNAVMDNGNIEDASVTVPFVITNFVIHSVSVAPSINKQIYGNYGKLVELEFYFDKSDISYYDEQTKNYWSTEYEYISDDNEIASMTATRQAINAILVAFNTDMSASSEQNKYLSFAFNSKYMASDFAIDEYSIKSLDKSVTYMSLSANNLLVNANSDVADLCLNYKLKLDDNQWVLDNSTTESISNTDTTAKIIEKREIYDLSFVMQNTLKDAVVILSEEDFLNISSGNTSYILGQDITLGNSTPYTPLDIDIDLFDGNGHTITIKKFDTFTDEKIQVGLFKQIYNDMVVSNLTVDYGESTFGTIYNTTTGFNIREYFDLCNGNADYTAVHFGGITPTNNGIITNCRTKGRVAFSASTIESKVSDYNIEFYMGGLVGINASTGYITNSTSSIKMFAKANIGGFAHTNEGKIVSSNFNGLVYAYNNAVATTSVVQVAGFVVDNNNHISMSYCDINTTVLNSSTNNTIGNLSAKDISAGFVYSNGGEIKDCYVDLLKIGANNNTFSGFVANNSNIIINCYSYINEGNKNSSVVNMFAPNGTIGIESSYEIMNIPRGYSNGVDGLTTLSVIERYDADNYLGFNFGDNKNAIWSIATGDIPKIVSTKNNAREIISGIEKNYQYGDINGATLYKGLKNIVEYTLDEILVQGSPAVSRTYREILLGNYGSENDPYLIYDIATWNEYMVDNLPKYYRIVKDIDFDTVYSNPITSTLTFSGNIEGNNMSISNYMIYSSNSLEAIGLFKEIVDSRDKNLETVVKNLTVSPKSILATRTKTVGALAGIIEDVNIYNIHANASEIIVGGNAVGGVAGLVRGAFNIEDISSNIGVNSTRASSKNLYSTYVSKNNGRDVSASLSNVYYAGSVFGIVDAYDNMSYNQTNHLNISKNYYYVKDVTVIGNMSIIGDTIGGAFGFVGERVYIDNVNVNLSSGALSGVQYSAGVVGENRGVINQAKFINDSTDTFNNSSNVSAGIVGFNAGGLIINSTFNGIIEKTNNVSVVAGIVGRNVNGSISNCIIDGALKGFFTGGAVGTDYTYDTLSKRISGAGSLTPDTIIAIPNEQIEYYDNNAIYTHLSNITIGYNLLDYWFKNMNNFYSYKASDMQSYDTKLNYFRVLGLVIGVTDSKDIEMTSYGYDNINNFMIINGEKSHDAVGIVNIVVNDNLSITSPMAEIINIDELSTSYVTYLIGARVGGFDYWTRGYSEEILIFTYDSAVSKLAIDSKEDFKVSQLNNIYVIDQTFTEGSIVNVTLTLDSIKYIFDNGLITKVTIGDNEYWPNDDIQKLENISVVIADNREVEITFTGNIDNEERDYSISIKLS